MPVREEEPNAVSRRKLKLFGINLDLSSSSKLENRFDPFQSAASRVILN
jgi:hypothetical protein